MSEFRIPKSLKGSMEEDVSPWASYERSHDSRRVLDSAAELVSKIDELTGDIVSGDALAVRNPKAKANQLGFIGINTSAINCPDTVSVIEAGQAVELYRGNEGFNPNTVAALWGDGDKLCVSALANVVANCAAWNQ